MATERLSEFEMGVGNTIYYDSLTLVQPSIRYFYAWTKSKVGGRKIKVLEKQNDN